MPAEVGGIRLVRQIDGITIGRHEMMDGFPKPDFTLCSLLYTSKCSIAGGPTAIADAVSDIVARSKANNSRQGISGALICTGSYFAQILEGPHDAVHDLMAAIAADSRHCDIEIAADDRVDRRMFGEWAMAYSGVTTFVDRYLSAARQSALPEVGSDVAVIELKNLMWSFCQAQKVPD